MNTPPVTSEYGIVHNSSTTFPFKVHLFITPKLLKPFAIMYQTVIVTLGDTFVIFG